MRIVKKDKKSLKIKAWGIIYDTHALTLVCLFRSNMRILAQEITVVNIFISI